MWLKFITYQTNNIFILEAPHYMQYKTSLLLLHYWEYQNKISEHNRHAKPSARVFKPSLLQFTTHVAVVGCVYISIFYPKFPLSFFIYQNWRHQVFTKWPMHLSCWPFDRKISRPKGPRVWTILFVPFGARLSAKMWSSESISSH